MIRAARLLAALLFACLGLVVTAGAPASAADCTCKQPGTLEQQAGRADVVFIGTIDKVAADGNQVTYDVTASRAYQGTPERETQVVASAGRKGCGLGDLKVGMSYLFLATGGAAPYTADGCGGTGPANPTKVTKVEQLLGEGTSVEPPPPPTAELTRVEDSPPAGFARAAAPGAAAAIIGALGLVVVRRLGRR